MSAGIGGPIWCREGKDMGVRELMILRDLGLFVSERFVYDKRD